MKKKAVSIVFGILIVAAGVLIGGQALGYWPDYKLSMDGWWTVFLILPGIVSICNHGLGAGNSIITGLGVLFLLDEQGILKDDLGYELAIPYVLIIIGLSLIFKKRESFEECDFREHNKGVYAGTMGETYFAIFGSNTPQLEGTDFRGASSRAIFGMVTFNLQNTDISRDCVINALSIFGKTDIVLPKDVRLLVHSVPVFGGVVNKFVAETPDKSSPAVLVRAVSVFGGTNIF